MGDDGFTVTFPDLQEYRRVELQDRLSGPMGWMVSLLATALGITDRTSGVLSMGVLIVSLLGSAGFSHRCRLAMKRLVPLINARFAVEFLLHTGYEYPQDIDILQVRETVPVRHDDGTVSLWSVKRRGDTFTVAPV